MHCGATYRGGATEASVTALERPSREVDRLLSVLKRRPSEKIPTAQATGS